MAKIKKIIKKMINKPREMRFEQVEAVLTHFNLMRKKKTKGSHFIYINEENDLIISVPKKSKKVKGSYIKEIVDILNLEEWYENQ